MRVFAYSRLLSTGLTYKLAGWQGNRSFPRALSAATHSALSALRGGDAGQPVERRDSGFRHVRLPQMRDDDELCTSAERVGGRQARLLGRLAARLHRKNGFLRPRPMLPEPPSAEPRKCRRISGATGFPSLRIPSSGRYPWNPRLDDPSDAAVASKRSSAEHRGQPARAGLRAFP